MSIFKFAYKKNVLSESVEESSLFFLNEANDIVDDETQSTKFVVKRRNPLGGFREFFGVINNPLHTVDDQHHPVPNLPFLDETSSDAYINSGLNKRLILSVDGKKIPLFTPPNFLSLAPASFGGVRRNSEQIAISAAQNRTTIYKYYTHLNSKFIKSLTEVNCNSVAYLYEYLNQGEKWQEGMEFYGYVDGLWEVGSFLTVTIDTPSWDVHTAIHELGHSVSYFLVDEFFNHWYDIAVDTTEEPPTAYAKTEVSEDFAESFGFYFSGASNQSMLKERCPRRFAYMASLENVGDKALLDGLTASVQLTRRFHKYDKVVYG